MTYSELLEKVLDGYECCGDDAIDCCQCPYYEYRWMKGKLCDCFQVLAKDVETLKDAMKELDQLKEQRLADLEYEREKAIFMYNQSKYNTV